MVALDDLMALLHDFMGDVGDKDPHMPNGLQVRGREEVNLLATGVSASLRLFEEAVARNADANDLVPFWIYRTDDPTHEALTIERRIPVFPLSREIGRMEQLKRSLVAYRSVIGQPRQQELLGFLSTHLNEDEIREFVESATIDLSPPQV